MHLFNCAFIYFCILWFIYLFIYLYLLIYLVLYWFIQIQSFVCLFIDLVDVAMYFCTYTCIHNKIAIIQGALEFEHINSDTWNIQKPAQHVLPILIPSTPHRPFVGARPRCGWQQWDPESRHGCPAGNAQSIPKRSSSCPHGLVCMAPSRHGSCQPRCESSSKTKKNDLQDEEQVEAGHDRRGQLAILVQGKRRPAVHLGLLTQGFR